MAKTPQISTKRIAISKANAQTIAVVGIATFITIFCLFAFKAAFNLNRYQSKVVSAKEKAHEQLENNIKTYGELRDSYRDFEDTNPNVIGGDPKGAGDKDGQNSKIVLNALPSSYDFPALTSSLEKILSDQSLKVSGITGTDDQLNQQGNSSSTDPQPVPVPFSFSISEANYGSINQLVTKLEKSIRPMQIDTINLSGSNASMTATISAHTYYQPAKSLDIKKQVVK